PPPLAVHAQGPHLGTNAPPYGRPPIQVITEPWRGGVRLRVKDQGPGLDEADCRAVVAPFTQRGEELSKAPGVETSTVEKSGYRSHGLGLAIVQRIAARHGGAVELLNRSQSPGGLEVRVWFPGDR
ncbi:MAG: ATP-binding protein, partial [Candidatus Competibacterales bacterium]